LQAYSDALQAYSDAFQESAQLVLPIKCHDAWFTSRSVGRKRKAQRDGALIFDEVKVAWKLMWNSRNNRLMGLAMTPKDLASLNDIHTPALIPVNRYCTYYSSC